MGLDVSLPVSFMTRLGLIPIPSGYFERLGLFWGRLIRVGWVWGLHSECLDDHVLKGGVSGLSWLDEQLPLRGLPEWEIAGGVKIR